MCVGGVRPLRPSRRQRASVLCGFGLEKFLFWVHLVVSLVSRREHPSSPSVPSRTGRPVLPIYRMTGMDWPEPQTWAQLPPLVFSWDRTSLSEADWFLR